MRKAMQLWDRCFAAWRGVRGCGEQMSVTAHALSRDVRQMRISYETAQLAYNGWLCSETAQLAYNGWLCSVACHAFMAVFRSLPCFHGCHAFMAEIHT